MFINQSNHAYNINLPTSTSREVAEWFEIMDSNGKLAEALVELVYTNLQSGTQLKCCESFADSRKEIQSPQNITSVNQNDFFDSLYSWQDSTSAIFKEEKKEKKTMLSV
ncbi:MAG: hypothetical protein N3B21_09620 [Clostridia bacterium]|nr:hypothetical protein [Clostridia bacterium]